MRLPSIDGIEDALRCIRPHLGETPLVRSELLSRGLDADVWIKNETVSPIGCFKLRGALTGLHRARTTGDVQGAVTSSTGNHGQGVAYGARLLELPSHVFLPLENNPLKKAMIRAFGATVHECGHDLDAAKAEARTFAAAGGHAFVDDGEGLGVMEGAGTVGLETSRALDSIDSVFIPMGSGCLAGGCAAAIKSVQPNARVTVVQSAGAPAMVESFRARKPIERPIETEIADGLVCREPAELALAALLESVSEAILVSDEDLLAGIHTLAECAHVLVEPAGAAALAGAWQQRNRIKGQRVVLVLTGANVTTDILERALRTDPLFPVRELVE